MKYLSDLIELKEIFKRSINVGLDRNDVGAIEQFHSPMSFEILLESMVRHIKETGQCAFTWTGPYGSGKSSLALFLTALSGKNAAFRKLAAKKLVTSHGKEIREFFQNSRKHWQVLTVTGSTESPAVLFKREMGLLDAASTDDILIEIQNRSREGAGILVFVDEMGKVFDGIAKNSEPDDIYFFQRLAEIANRSEGRIVLIGILHQSFMEYARNLAKKVRDEWNKIQGRFVDLAVNISADEQIFLIAQAMEKKAGSKVSEKSIRDKTASVVQNISRSRKIDTEALEALLNNTWPLHPLTTVLLCELSKKRFGQNQRSIFSFLMSAEPRAFRDYLRQTPVEQAETYTPPMLWDYLETNLDSLLSVSAESKQWLVAKDAIARYNNHANELYGKVLKTIAVCNLLKGNSGVSVDTQLLETLFDKNALAKILEDLSKSSVIVYRKYASGYVLTDGSDFDIEAALDVAYAKIQGNGFDKLRAVANFKPVLAKRHYHQTGALRWMSIELFPVSEQTTFFLKNLKTDHSLIGSFVVLVPTDQGQFEFAKNITAEIAPSLKNIAINVATNYLKISEYASELLALEWIDDNDVRIVNDIVARKEVQNRISFVRNIIEKELYQTIDLSDWTLGATTSSLEKEDLSDIASNIADCAFGASPCIMNEMLNREKPSSNANAALNALLKRMVLNRDKQDLGIQGFPPEMGLYRSILQKNRLHVETETGFAFVRPESAGERDSGLALLWADTDKYLQQCESAITAEQIYQRWQQSPYGVKKGLLPVLLVSYILSNVNNIACYIEDHYQTHVDDLLIDYLIKAPRLIGLLSVGHAHNEQKWIRLLAIKLNQTAELNTGGYIENQPLAVARALVYIVDALDKWTHRTKQLNRTTLQLRDFIRNADDPNKLLFESIPSLFEAGNSDVEKSTQVIASLKELHVAFPDLMARFENEMFKDLRIDPSDEKRFGIVQSRAKMIRGKSGDFKTDAFISRLSTFGGRDDEMAAIVSLLADKPTSDWIDQDLERAGQRLSVMCDMFNRAEIYAKVESGSAGRYRIGVVAKGTTKVSSSFLDADVFDHEEPLIDEKLKALSDSIAQLGNDRLKIAVLARLIENLGD